MQVKEKQQNAFPSGLCIHLGRNEDILKEILWQSGCRQNELQDSGISHETSCWEKEETGNLVLARGGACVWGQNVLPSD